MLCTVIIDHCTEHTSSRSAIRHDRCAKEHSVTFLKHIRRKAAALFKRTRARTEVTKPEYH